jgi:RNase P/RNase MRP subunit p29
VQRAENQPVARRIGDAHIVKTPGLALHPGARIFVVFFIQGQAIGMDIRNVYSEGGTGARVTEMFRQVDETVTVPDPEIEWQIRLKPVFEFHFETKKSDIKISGGGLIETPENGYRRSKTFHLD